MAARSSLMTYPVALGRSGTPMSGERSALNRRNPDLLEIAQAGVEFDCDRISHQRGSGRHRVYLRPCGDKGAPAADKRTGQAGAVGSVSGLCRYSPPLSPMALSRGQRLRQAPSYRTGIFPPWQRLVPNRHQARPQRAAHREPVGARDPIGQERSSRPRRFWARGSHGRRGHTLEEDEVALLETMAADVVATITTGNADEEASENPGPATSSATVGQEVPQSKHAPTRCVL